jgi:integrase
MSKPYASLERLLALEQAQLKRALISENTLLGYSYDWKMFTAWCQRMERHPLPADLETVALYLTDVLHSGKKISTAVRRSSAIANRHREAGLETPINAEIKRLLRGAQRLRGEQPRQMRPLSVRELRAIAERLVNIGSPLALRNRAILVIGFASALRRESLAGLRLGDVEQCERGLVLTVRREKQDQEGRGRYIGIPRGALGSVTCPVCSLEAWIQIRGDCPGPLFTRVVGDRLRGIQGEAIGRVVKACVAMIGLDPTDYCGHSLRAGFVTAAGEAGAGDLQIAAQTGHHSPAMVRRYFRRSDVWRGNACAAIGL